MTGKFKMYVRREGLNHNYEIRKGGPRKKYVCKEGVPKFFPVIQLFFFFFEIALRYTRDLTGATLLAFMSFFFLSRQVELKIGFNSDSNRI